MQSELNSLSKIFSESIFRIPDYQRGYSWEPRHLKDFWNDIDQLTDGKNHYTGVLTLEPVSQDDYSRWQDDLWIIEAKHYKPLYVVDGQQRLTTAVILLQVILEAVPEGKELNYTSAVDIRKKYIFESKDRGISRSYIFGYETDNPSHEFLKQSIFMEASDEHSLPEATIYTKNLESAKAYFTECLKGLSLPEIEKIFTKLTQNLHFNIFYIEADLDVFVTFETMNNRGKALSHLELLKNRLIYLSTRFDVEKSEREKLRSTVNESWKTIYHYLGRATTDRINDDSFLLTHFLCYFGPGLPKRKPSEDDHPFEYDIRRYVHDGDMYKDMLLENVFTPKRLLSPEKRLTIEEIYKYAQDIKRVVKIFYWVVEPTDSADSGWSEAERVKLSQIGRVGKYNSRLLAVAAMIHVKSPEVRLEMLTAIERIAFLSRIRPHYFNDVGLEKYAIALVGNESNPAEVIHQLELSSDKFSKSAEFRESIRSIGKGTGYYGWGVLRYFMYEYEQKLRIDSKTSRQLLDWKDYANENYEFDHRTIEHIYPQQVADPYWKTRFDKYIVQERNMLKNSLGNLLPVSHPKNSSLSNKSFDLKKGSKDNQVGYQYGCLAEIQVAQESSWEAIHVLRRGVALLEFMEVRWRIKLGSAADKVTILGLDFVISKEGTTLERALELPLPIPRAPDEVVKAPVLRRIKSTKS